LIVYCCRAFLVFIMRRTDIDLDKFKRLLLAYL